MTVNRACYCTRSDVLSATDIPQAQDFLRHLDSGLEAGSDEVDRVTKRRFWNAIETSYWDWPNFQRAYPWRVWLDAKELADRDGTGPLGLAPVLTTGVQSSSPTVIPASALKWGYGGNWNYGPPWNSVEILRSTSYSFGNSDTPQQDISIRAVFGYWSSTRPAGTLAASVSTTSATTLTVSDSYDVGVGDVIISGTEQMLVRDAAFTSTGVTASAGGTLADASDNALTVADGTKFTAGEPLQVDAEQMLITSITGNVLTVVRAWNGTVLAAHVTVLLYAQRLLTVQRGFGGTTAATHAQGDAVVAQLIPAQVRELAIAESLNFIYQKTSAYARTIGENERLVPGGSLPDLRSRVLEAYGRRARQRVI